MTAELDHLPPQPKGRIATLTDSFDGEGATISGMMDGTSYCIDPDSWAAERAAALGSTPVVIAIDDKIVAKYGGLANLNAPHETRIPVEHFDSISPDGEWTVPSIFQKSELYLNHGARGTISGRWASAAISWLVQDRAAEF